MLGCSAYQKIEKLNSVEHEVMFNLQKAKAWLCGHKNRGKQTLPFIFKANKTQITLVCGCYGVLRFHIEKFHENC